MFIKLTHPSFIKARPENSASLSAAEKMELSDGLIPIAAWSEVNGHYKFTLTKTDGVQATYLGRNTVYIWTGHAVIADKGGKEITKEKVLKVPFYPQTDNYYDPDGTCSSSSHAMLLNYLLPGSVKSDDEYVKKVFQIGQSVDDTVHTRLLRQYGIESEWHRDGDFKDIERSIAKGIPAVIGILHRGSEKAPTGGHILIVRGITDAGSFAVNDPYGDLKSNYSDDVENGHGAIYSRRLMNARWLVYQANEGWYRRVISVKGKPTGL